MCSINHELEAIYIHIPKCGGLYIEKILENKYNFKTHYFTHENNQEFVGNEIYHENTPKNLSGFLNIKHKGILRYFMSSEIHNKATGMTMEKWKTYKKFTFIRNPYDRFISGWKYLNKSKLHNYTEISDYLSNKNNLDNYSYFHTFVSQYENLLNLDNKIDIDYFGRFENLNEDLCDILIKLGVKKIIHTDVISNDLKFNSSGHEEYPNYYNVITINEINNLLQDDFNYFVQFKKVETIDDMKTESKKYIISDEQFNKNNSELLKRLDLDGKSCVDISDTIKCVQQDIINRFKFDNNIHEEQLNNTIQLENGITIDTNSTQQEALKILSEINISEIYANIFRNIALAQQEKYKNKK